MEQAGVVSPYRYTSKRVAVLVSLARLWSPLITTTAESTFASGTWSGVVPGGTKVMPNATSPRHPMMQPEVSWNGGVAEVMGVWNEVLTLKTPRSQSMRPSPNRLNRPELFMPPSTRLGGVE